MIPLLNTALLAAARTTLTATLTDSAQIQRRTATSDGMGGQTETWTTIATVACRVTPRDTRSAEATVGDTLRATAQWTLTLPALTDVRATDRVMVGTRTFEVAAPLGPRSYELSRRVACVEVV